MVEASSLGLADSLTQEERSMGLIYPRIERIREISAHIAKQVIRASQVAVSPSYFSQRGHLSYLTLDLGCRPLYGTPEYER